MYPSKRHRGDSPRQSYFSARVYAPSPLGRYGRFESDDDSNRSVRAPALAPTTRFERPTFTTATQRSRSLYGAPERHPRTEDPEAEYIREVSGCEDDWGPRGVFSRRTQPPSSTPSPQLPGLSQLFHTTRRRPLSPDTRICDDDDSEEEDTFRSRGKFSHAFRQSARTTFMKTNPPGHGVAERFRHGGSPETATSSGSTPFSGSVSFRDSTDGSDALPIRAIPSRAPPASLVRTDSVSSVETSTPPGSKALPSYPGTRSLAKSSRYLREIDRRNILQRIENGEKQAALAKEYQVSRAAICNLNKHREVVLSRKDENPLAKHPKRPRPKGVPAKIKITSKPAELASNSAFACELKSRSTSLLLTLLRSPETNATDFRRYADRILRLILEEALSLVPVKSVHVPVNESVQIEGVEAERPTCAVALEVTGGMHFLRVFHALEPHQPTGSIRIRGAQVDSHVPPDLASHNVFLFDLFTYSGEMVSTALALLISRGVRENCVWLVSLCVAYEVAELIHTRFPQVKIITAQVDRSNMPVPSDNTSASPQTTLPPSPSPDGSEAVAPVITKPDIATKVLVKRFLQVYEPRRATRPADANNEPQEQLI